MPVLVSEPTAIAATVYEDSLNAATNEGDDNDATPQTDDQSTGNNNDDHPGDGDEADDGGLAVNNLQSLFSTGADEPLSIALSDNTDGLPQLYSNGEQLQYTVDNSTAGVSVLTARTDSEAPPIFTLTVNAAGTWSFDLDGQLDHAPGEGDDDAELGLLSGSEGQDTIFAIDFSSILVATDADGDTATLDDDGIFTIAVENDVPDAVTNAPLLLVGLDTFPVSNPNDFLFAETTAAAALGNGSYIIAWEVEDEGSASLAARLYDADGAPLADISPDDPDELGITPATTALNGGFVITWQEDFSDSIRAQIFDANGLPLDGSFEVAAEGDSTTPAVTALADGNFVVTWSQNPDADTSEGGTVDIFAQIYDAVGNALLENPLAVTTTDNDVHEFMPAVTALDNEGFVVAWLEQANTVEGENYAIRAQVFNNADGDPGAAITVTPTGAAEDSPPSVAAFGDDFIVTWSQTGSTEDILAQIFNAAGVAQGGPIEVSATDFADEFQPKVAELADGGFVIVWGQRILDEEGARDIFARVYDADGNARGDAFLVSSVDVTDERQPSVTALDDGGFVVAWVQADEVYARVYDASSTAIRGVRDEPLALPILASLNDTDGSEALIVKASLPTCR